MKKKKSYLSGRKKSLDEANAYEQTQKSLFRYLAYRDLPPFIEKYAKGKKTLDYGAGTGASSQFLSHQGLDVQGVDVNESMLGRAKEHHPEIPFFCVENGKLPFPSESFDLIFSSFVLFEMGEKDLILSYLKEGFRVLKQEGVFIVITSSPTMYTGQWLVMGTNYPENAQAKSGDLVKIFLPQEGIEFTDYFWSAQDYESFFQQAGLEILEIYHPLGSPDEPFEWKDERRQSPYSIYFLKKKDEKL